MNHEKNNHTDNGLHVNYHARRFASLERAEQRLRLEIQEATSKQTWWDEFDAEGKHGALSQLRRSIQATREQIGVTDRDIASNSVQLVVARKEAQTGFLGRFYKTSEQSAAALLVNKLAARVEKMQREKSRLETSLANEVASEQPLAADLDLYRSFDSLGTKAMLEHTALELQQILAGQEQAAKASARWEESMGALANEYGQLAKQIRAVEEDLIVLDKLCADYERQGSDKGQVRKALQNRFGADEGLPAHVKRKRAGELDKLQRDAGKMEKRLRDKQAVLDQNIAKFIIDGSNLCYVNEKEKRRFIGLEPLKALVPKLCESYSVDVWFDPGIIGQTKMSQTQLQNLLPGARVNVMRSKVQADAAIIGAAEFDEHAYIISNDIYREFVDKPFIKDRRFEHNIHDYSIQIIALDLNMPYAKNPSGTAVAAA